VGQGIIGENNVSGSQVYPYIDFEWVGSSRSMRQEQFFGAWKMGFSAEPDFMHKRGRNTKKMNRKGKLQTSRISSNWRIWQSYSRVPQILNVFCAGYSWIYVTHLGFEPLKFLYSDFFYNTQTVHFTLHTPHSTLYTLQSTLYTPHSTLIYTIHFTFHTLRSRLYTLHFALRTLHSTLDTLHFTLYASHFILRTWHSTLYTLQTTLYTLHSLLYTPHSALQTLHSVPYTLHFTLRTLHFRL